MLGNKKPGGPAAPSVPASKPVDTIDTLIGQKTVFKGDVEFSGGLRVDGKVNGSIIARDENNSTLVLSEMSEVEGNISVPHVIVNGTVRGNIKSTAHIELQPNSRIIGDVQYKGVEMQLGASINGNLVCDTSKPDDPTGSNADNSPNPARDAVNQNAD
jgi:cytoskeletal protein CcmA (bactofilin family)